jgi:hypothetical protein
MCVSLTCALLQARCAAASRAAEAAAAERDLLERKVARLEKGKETELKGEHFDSISSAPLKQVDGIRFFLLHSC